MKHFEKEFPVLFKIISSLVPQTFAMEDYFIITTVEVNGKREANTLALNMKVGDNLFSVNISKGKIIARSPDGMQVVSGKYDDKTTAQKVLNTILSNNLTSFTNTVTG